MANTQTVTESSPAPSIPSALPLRVVSLVKRFGQTTAVDDISLEVGVGECVGLLGPNGAGKSTLIRSIVGRNLPNAGSVQIFGLAAGSTGARMALGWVPQELALYPRITARENLACFGRYYGLSGAELAEAAAWCLKWAALEDKSSELCKNLSGGMKRRLNMAAGLIHRPRIVLMDEPTVGVDPQSRNRIFEMIESLRAEGTAIVYTTHYMEEAETLCHRLAIVDRGKIIAAGTLAELRALLAERDLLRLSGIFHPDAARAALQPIDHSEILQADEHLLIVALPEASRRLPAIFSALAAAGAEVRGTTLTQPSLESLFIKLTGKELRE